MIQENGIQGLKFILLLQWYCSDDYKLYFLFKLPKSQMIKYLKAHQFIMPNNKPQKPHTIIIGAGLAGLTAANFLSRKNHKILVLQASDFIGGRTKSTPIINPKTQQKLIFDEGASWIHNYTNYHPLVKIGQELQNFKMVDTDYQCCCYFDQSGKDVGSVMVEEKKDLEGIMEQVYKEKGRSVQQAISNIDKSKLSNPYFMHLYSKEYESQTSCSIAQLAAHEGQNDHYFDDEDDGEEMLVLGGYNKFAKYLARHKNIEVRMECEVVEVRRREADQSEVITRDGEVFVAKNILITVPLSILKANSITFTPPLPEKKLEAIKNIQFGNMCKMMLIFPKQIIQRKEHVLSIVSKDIGSRGLASFFINLQAIADIPALITFGVGESALEAEQMDEQQLKKILAAKVSILAGKPIKPTDFQLARSSWGSNPFFKGSYSYGGLTTKCNDWQEMARPVFKNKWFFAGQHTWSWYRGTAHGACSAGKEAAWNILDQRKNREALWEYWAKEDLEEK